MELMKNLQKEGPVSSTKPHDVAGQQGRSYGKKNLV
jgi:hypothetical protein